MAQGGAELTCNTQCGSIIITERLLLWQAYHSWNSSDNEVVTKTVFLFPLWTSARIMNHSLFFQIIKNHYIKCVNQVLNTLRPRQNGRHFADDTFKYIFLNENVRISAKISLKFVPKGPINNIPALVQIMAWRRPGGKPLSEPMMVRLPTHTCVTRPQWVNSLRPSDICGKLNSIGLENGLSPGQHQAII